MHQLVAAMHVRADATAAWADGVLYLAKDGSVMADILGGGDSVVTMPCDSRRLLLACSALTSATSVDRDVIFARISCSSELSTARDEGGRVSPALPSSATSSATAEVERVKGSRFSMMMDVKRTEVMSVETTVMT